MEIPGTIVYMGILRSPIFPAEKSKPGASLITKYHVSQR
jgi:hypothetical protein